MANEIGSSLLNAMTRTGIDVGSMSKIIAEAEVAGPRSILDRSEKRFSTELNALNYLQSNLSAFNTYVTDLTSPDLFKVRNATSSNDAIVSVSATTSAVPANYSVESVQLAQSHTMVAGRVFNSRDDMIPQGELVINGQRVVIDGTNNTLEGLQRAINAQDIGVSASVINNAGQFQLMLSSQQTGASSQFGVSGAAGDDLFDYFSADADKFDVLRDASLNPLSEGRDALMRINGVEVSSSSNTFDDVISGLTFNLNGLSTSAQSVSVSRDTQKPVDVIKDFVNVFNQLQDILKNLGSYTKLSEDEKEDPENEFKGDLAGNSILRDLRTQIRSTISGALEGATGSFNTLSSVGVSFDRFGMLELDEQTLNSVASANMDALAGLFATGGKASDPMVNFLGGSTRTQQGSFDLEITRVAQRATLASDVAVGAVNLEGMDIASRTFSVKVDDSATVDIVLGEVNYASAQDFAKALTHAINSNSSVKSVSGEVSAFIDGDGLLNLSSNRYGSGSRLELDLTQIAGSGFTDPAKNDRGVNVDGYLVMSDGVSRVNIGAYADLSDGRKVKISDFARDSSGNAAQVRGLEFEVLGGAATPSDTGAGFYGEPRGSLTFTQGFASNLFETVNGLLDANDGVIGRRINSLASNIEQLDEKREKIDLRYEKLELRYRMQFSMMQSILAEMQGTRDFLTSTFNRPNNN